MNRVVFLFPWSWQTMLLMKFLLLISMDLARRWPEPSGTPHTSSMGRAFGLRLGYLLESIAQFRLLNKN